MGCNCGGKRGTPRQFRKRATTPSVGPRSIQGGSASGPTPSTLRALGIQSAQSVKSSKRLDEQRRKEAKLRRDALRRSLNK